MRFRLSKKGPLVRFESQLTQLFANQMEGYFWFNINHLKWRPMEDEFFKDPEHPYEWELINPLLVALREGLDD